MPRPQAAPTLTMLATGSVRSMSAARSRPRRRPPPRPDASSVKERSDPSGMRTTTTIYVDGADTEATVYDRAKLLAGNVVTGPAIVTEMDSTTLVLPGHAATVHPSGSLLIRPSEGE